MVKWSIFFHPSSPRIGETAPPNKLFVVFAQITPNAPLLRFSYTWGILVMIFIGESFSIFEISTLSLQLVLTIFFLRNKMANQCRHRPMMNFFLWWKLRPNCSMVSPWHLIKTEPRLVCLKSRNWYCGDHKWHNLIWDFSRQNVVKASKLISIIFVWFLYFWEHLTYCDLSSNGWN